MRPTDYAAYARWEPTTWRTITFLKLWLRLKELEFAIKTRIATWSI